jgi:hypothetical protein
VKREFYSTHARQAVLTAVVLIAGFSTVLAMAAEKRAYKRTSKLDKVWSAEGFDFSGYDALLVTEVTVDPAVKPKDDKERDRLELAKVALPRDLVLAIESRKVVKTTTLKESDLPAGKRLKLETRVLKFSRGSSTARYGVGFGAGMPYIKVNVLVTDLATSEPLLEAELDEKADWFASGYTGSRSLQAGATMELTDDLAAFMGQLARHEQIKYKK